MTVELPKTLEEAKSKYDEFISTYTTNLKLLGVKPPPKWSNSKGVISKGAWFYLYAYCYLGIPFKGIDVTTWVNKTFGLQLTEDPQVLRHMSNLNGFNARSKGGILPNGTKISSGSYCLVDMLNASPDWKNARQSAVQSGDWELIKKQYNYKCACCGSKEGEPNNKKSSKITKLEQGHMNPNKNLEPGNIIPQCEVCNKPYKNNVVFDSEGYVYSLGNSTLVLRSDLSVKQQILKDLFLNEPELFTGIL